MSAEKMNELVGSFAGADAGAVPGIAAEIASVVKAEGLKCMASNGLATLLEVRAAAHSAALCASLASDSRC